MTTINPPPPTSANTSFDQIVKGDVCIKKLSKFRYRITFSKIGKFLKYQVWDKDNVNNTNNKRKVGYVSAKEWVNNFINTNKRLKKNDEPLFTPTTIMETEDDGNYAFVMHKAYINSSDRVVFTVSTKEISLQNNTSKKLIQLPHGKFNNMRFDIDFWGVSRWIDAAPKYCCVDNNKCFNATQQAWSQQGEYDWFYYEKQYISQKDLENNDYLRNDDGTPWAWACNA
jgi:hypothetical protein